VVDDDWTGRLIDGRYAVESVLGKGGMGLVLKARHKFTGVQVAVKVLRPELQLDTEVQMRFLGEARAPNAIGHPGIVQVVDAGKAPDGLLYLVMELLQGRPLREPLARGELTHPELRRIMMELFDALAAAHVRGFVHRDLKPENVFLAGPAATVKLLDFGIAKVLDAGLARVQTGLGVLLGTPAYMAPEQVSDASGVDARADLWAAGIMIYEMLSGHLPFVGDTTGAFFAAIATKDPTPIRAFLPSAPPALDAFFSRALARELFRRFASAQEMAHAFAALPLGFAPTGTAAAGSSSATVATGAAIAVSVSPAARSAIGYEATHTPHQGAAVVSPPASASSSTPAVPPMYAPPASASSSNPAAPSMYGPPEMPGASSSSTAAHSMYAPPEMPAPGARHPPSSPHIPQPAANLHPASSPPPMSQPVAPVHVAPRRAPTDGDATPATRSRTGLMIGAIGVLALIAAVAVVAFGRGGGTTVAKPGSAAPIDAAVVAQTPVDAPAIDAAPVDAAVVRVPRDAGAKTVLRDAGAAEIDAGTPIDAGVTKVGGAMKVDGGVMKVDGGVIKSRCASTGTTACRTAMNCQRDCEDNDNECRCRCASLAHPSHQQAITAYATCAKSCGFGKVCITLNCKKVFATCLAR